MDFYEKYIKKQLPKESLFTNVRRKLIPDVKNRSKKDSYKNYWGKFILSSLTAIFYLMIYILVGCNFIWYSTRCINIKDSDKPEFTLEELLPTNYNYNYGTEDEQEIINGTPSVENIFYFPNRLNISLDRKRKCINYNCDKDNNDSNIQKLSYGDVRDKLDSIFLNKHGFPYNMITQNKFRDKYNYLIDSKHFVSTNPHEYFSIMHLLQDEQNNEQNDEDSYGSQFLKALTDNYDHVDEEDKSMWYVLSIETLKNWVALITGNTFAFFRWLFKSFIMFFNKEGLLSSETLQILLIPLLYLVAIHILPIAIPIYVLFSSVITDWRWLLYTVWNFYSILPLVLTSGIMLSFIFSLLIVPLILSYKDVLHIMYCNRELIIFLIGLTIVFNSFPYLHINVSSSMFLGFIIVSIIRFIMLIRKKNK